MAITKSAKKALRQAKRKKAMNDLRKKAVRSAFKQVRLAAKGDTKVLAAAYKAIDKAAKTGVIKKHTAARRKAKVARMLKSA